MSLEEKVAKFKELMKARKGKGVEEALAEAGLSKRRYRELYDEIWSDPELQPFKPNRRRSPEGWSSSSKPEGGASSSPPPPPPEKPPEVRPEVKPEAKPRGEKEDVEALLQEYIGGETEFERRWGELKREELKLVKAAMKILGVRELPPPAGQQPPPPPQPAKEAEGRRSAIDEFKEAFRGFEEKRREVRKLLEDMGFKVEDVYMRREEVERLLEEARRRAMEEALEDKRIEAVKSIISEAVDKVVNVFRPAVDVLLGVPPAPAAAGGEGPSRRSEGASASRPGSA